MSEVSQVKRDSPRINPWEVLVSWLIRNGRKSAYAAEGSANRLRPDPPFAGLPAVPIPLDPGTFVCRPVLVFKPPFAGMLS
jgi:hypothetical protein